MTRTKKAPPLVTGSEALLPACRWQRWQRMHVFWQTQMSAFFNLQNIDA